VDLWQAPLGLSGLVWKSSEADSEYQHLQRQDLDGDTQSHGAKTRFSHRAIGQGNRPVKAGGGIAIQILATGVAGASERCAQYQ
jgi:hypothetical protein